MDRAIILYLLIINVSEFYLMYADKNKAIKGLWRIPEKTLLLVSAVGGSLGGVFGMYVFRHKTKKSKFVIGIPLILVLQIFVAFFIKYKIT